MSSKQCITCFKVLPLTSYYKHKQMADGHLNKCKECQKACSKAARNRDPDKYREYDNARANNPKRVEARKSYQKTPEGRAAQARAKRVYLERYPMRRAAHIIVGNAVRDGKLIKPEAYESCGSQHKIEGHHDDYTKPLSIRWLCQSCHNEWHRQNEPVYI